MESPPDSPPAPANQPDALAALPGHTIDDLRAQGRPAEARAEFERLIQEGLDSGVDPRPPASIFDSVRSEIRSRAAAPTSNPVSAQG